MDSEPIVNCIAYNYRYVTDINTTYSIETLHFTTARNQLECTLIRLLRDSPCFEFLTEQYYYKTSCYKIQVSG